jgi:hypothetical protein
VPVVRDEPEDVGLSRGQCSVNAERVPMEGSRFLAQIAEAAEARGMTVLADYYRARALDVAEHKFRAAALRVVTGSAAIMVGGER